MSINNILMGVINERAFNHMKGQFNDKLFDFFDKSGDLEPDFKTRRFYSNLNTELIKKQLNIDPNTLGKILNSDKMMKILKNDFPEPDKKLNKNSIVKKLDVLIDKIINAIL